MTVSQNDRARRAFWECLDPSTRDALSASAQPCMFPRSRVLTQQGDTCDILIIRTGWAKVTATAPGGQHEVTLRLHGPGDLVDDDVALTGRPRRTTITAITDVHALALPASEFMSVAVLHPNLTRALHRLQEDRLDDAEQRIIAASADASIRIAQLLLDLCDRYGSVSPQGVTIPIPLSQAELAAWAGTSRKTVVRALSRMRHDGLVTTDYLTITVKSPSRLRAYLAAVLGLATGS